MKMRSGVDNDGKRTIQPLGQPPPTHGILKLHPAECHPQLYPLPPRPPLDKGRKLACPKV